MTILVCVCSRLQVQLFRWIEKDDGVQELQTECGYHGHTVALNMQVNVSYIVFVTASGGKLCHGNSR